MYLIKDRENNQKKDKWEKPFELENLSKYHRKFIEIFGSNEINKKLITSATKLLSS